MTHLGPKHDPLMMQRTTLARSFTCEGIGLHSGMPARMVVEPASPGAGISFLRKDVAAPTGLIPAHWDLVTDTRLCTVLTNEHGVSVATVEHVMAALAGMGIDDARVVLDGPEIPVMDGSSAEFVRLISGAGVVEHGGLRKAILVRRDVTVEDEGTGARVTLCPATGFDLSISFEIDFAARAIGRQVRDFTLRPGSFARELANSRTFGMAAEVEMMRAHGLALGGSLENAVVVDNDRVLNPDGLRHKDEFVRHKLLDAVGDFALAGMPLIARATCYKAGHAMNNRALHALFADPANYQIIRMPRTGLVSVAGGDSLRVVAAGAASGA